MQKEYNHKQNTYIIIALACIGVIFSGRAIINAFEEEKIYQNINNPAFTTSQSDIAQQILHIQQTVAANKAVQDKKYSQALAIISGATSQDYYNRGTIQTLRAYENALQSNISWLEQAQLLATQAQQSFDIASKLSPPKELVRAIHNNLLTNTALATIIDIKTCYGVGQGIVDTIDDITQTIANITATLHEEQRYIETTTLSPQCYQRLKNIADTSIQDIQTIQTHINKDKREYISDFTHKIDNPKICIDTPYENIIPSLLKGKQWLEWYQQLHQNTINALKNNNTQNIQELCEQTKNDAQINQQISSAVQELFQTLQDNKPQEQSQPKNSQKIPYEDFFDKDEKKILKDIQTTNKWRIQNILNIRGKGNYDPERYINDMFNQFYGNSGDFVNLHK